MTSEQKNEHSPADDEEARKQGEQAQRELDKTPPPGTDPLHEGP
jgi:hypothetical protein